MTILPRGSSKRSRSQRAFMRVLAGFGLLLLTALPAHATLLPEGFFDMVPAPGGNPAAVEADQMSYEGGTGTIAADGKVVMSYQGFTLTADRVEYNMEKGSVMAVGHVTLTNGGTVMHMDSIEVTGGLKEAFLNSLTITTDEGARITAGSVHFQSDFETMLTDASYSPCGLCIDSKGRKIGWKVKAAKIHYSRDHASVTLEQPSLELLGIPVAWLPWFWVPDPSQPRATGLRMPSVDYDGKRGAVAAIPYFIPVGEDIDLVLTPQLMSRQGVLMGGALKWRLPPYGEVSIRASGLYQLDKSAFAGTVGDRQWRGAIQTSGRFTPADHWTAGWSYSTFTDQAYLIDYKFTDADSYTNRVYGTYLNEMTYFDARIERGNLLGNYTTDDPAQATLLPQVTFDHVQDLAPGFGRAHLSGELLRVTRGADQLGIYGGVPYVTGYEGTKQHLALEAAWEDQFILPGGLVATPYLGARLDASSYDRTLGPIGAPYPTEFDNSLLSVTPIAAMDVRWPLVAKSGFDTHLLEPVAQLVYRGSSTTDVGITNDDAQSFVFDTSNLFTYNHFSGIDRQDTGLQANIGAHYLGNFADGSWLDLVAGQSFHLAGVNAFGVSDAAQTGTSTGLGSAESYLVGSARAGFANGLTLAGKLQVDPSTPRITRAGAGGSFTFANGLSTSGTYLYIAKDAALGTTVDQHEIQGAVGIPVADYWRLNGDLTWNLENNSWLRSDVGVTYDDGYLVLGAGANFTPTSWGTGFTFKLKGPDGQPVF
ncbi:MAG TPA: LPS assembly protein LptD [Devosia sp.]|nr:LPS assembly protein LptD [Devosia sp.]